MGKQDTVPWCSTGQKKREIEKRKMTKGTEILYMAHRWDIGKGAKKKGEGRGGGKGEMNEGGEGQETEKKERNGEKKG